MKNLFLLMFFPSLILAQAPTSEKGTTEPVTKVVHVRYGLAQTIADLARTGASVSILGDNGLKAVVVHGAPGEVTAVEQVIRELDVPSAGPAKPQTSQDVEIMVYVLGASSSSSPIFSENMPDVISPVIKQLRAVFPYKNYGLVSSMLLRTAIGSHAESQGSMRSLSDGSGGSDVNVYNLGSGRATRVSDGTPAAIHLEKFSFQSTFRAKDRPMVSVGLNTDIDLQEDQKVVVGKANLEGDASALFVVLSAKLMP